MGQENDVTPAVQQKRFGRSLLVFIPNLGWPETAIGSVQ